MQPARGGRRPSGKPDEPGQAHSFYDDFGVKWKEVDTGVAIYREIAESPLVDTTIDDLDRYPWWPNPFDPDRYVGVKENHAAL